MEVQKGVKVKVVVLSWSSPDRKDKTKERIDMDNLISILRFPIGTNTRIYHHLSLGGSVVALLEGMGRLEGVS